MRVLCVTPMYPEPTNPAFGSFVAHLNRGLEQHADVKVDVIRRRAGRRGAMSYVDLIKSAGRSLRRGEHHDLVVGHYLGPSAGVALTLSKILRLPLVLTAHGSDIEAARWRGPRLLMQQLMRWADGLHLVSRDLEVRATELLGELPTTRLIQSMGVDLERFAPVAEMPPPTRTTCRILAVAHLVQSKGWADLVATVATLKARGHDIELVGYGGGDSAWVRRLAHDHGVGDLIRLRGNCSPDMMPEIYQDADIVLVASHREGFGLVGLEAMACGRPLVATASGGPMDYLEPDINALVVSPGDVGASADAVGRLLEDDALVSRLVRHGRQTAARFGVDAAAKAVGRFYAAIAATG